MPHPMSTSYMLLSNYLSNFYFRCCPNWLFSQHLLYGWPRRRVWAKLLFNSSKPATYVAISCGHSSGDMYSQLTRQWLLLLLHQKSMWRWSAQIFNNFCTTFFNYIFNVFMKKINIIYICIKHVFYTTF